jgi:hypothetical protein
MARYLTDDLYYPVISSAREESECDCTCAVGIQRRGWPRPYFVCDAKGMSIMEAHINATALGHLIADYLNTRSLRGRPRYIANLFCKQFRIPDTDPKPTDAA